MPLPGHRHHGYADADGHGDSYHGDAGDGHHEDAGDGFDGNHGESGGLVLLITRRYKSHK